MGVSSPYVRTFVVGAIWFAMVGVTMVSRHPGHWSSYPPRNFLVLVGAWVITALLLGVVATRFVKLRSWLAIGLGTMVGSLAVPGLMLLVIEKIYRVPTVPKFKKPEEMMVYFANEAAKWVKHDRGIALDYSVDSIKIVDEELVRISKEIDRANPPQGTFGLASGYGAYVGEVIRRRSGGVWAIEQPVGGPRSYLLTIQSNITIFPVDWCWKRLTTGEGENVYDRATVLIAGGGR